MICACKGCEEKTTMKVLGYLNHVQKAMLGYFCGECIKAACSNGCNKVRV